MYRERIKRLNGVNLIYENEQGDIFLAKSTLASPTDGKFRFKLPGGSINSGEPPRHATCAKMTETTSIHFNEKDIDLVGIMMQITPGVTETNGFVFLYRAQKYAGNPILSEKLSEYNYFSHEEIIELAKEHQKNTIGLGYLRMICHYINWKQNGGGAPFEIRLSDPVSISQKIDLPLIKV